MAVPKKRNSKKTTVSFPYTMGTFDNFIKLFFSENNLIDNRIFSKLSALFDLSDFSSYDDDIDMFLRIRIINFLLDARYVNRITDPNMLLDSCLDGEFDEETNQIIQDVYDDNELSNDDIKFIDNYISERIHYANLFSYLPLLADLNTQLQAGTTSIPRINEKAKGVLDAFNTSIKVAKMEIDATSNDFSSVRSETEVATDKVIKKKKDSAGLKTAVKELNRLLNGRFYNSRFYLLLAAPKRGKSTTLLNLALQCKHVNSDIKVKDPTKRPSIMYLTQENTVHETIERLWSYYFGSERLVEISDYTTEEAIEKLNEAGFINADDKDDGIVFQVKYRKNNTISAAGIKDIVDGMAEEGLECVGIFHDYLKRLKPIEHNADERLKYGNISNDLSDLCKELDIPIISAMQLSRKAVEILENKALNAGKNLGSSLIGESFLIIENVDAAMIINLTKTKDGKSYMFFKLTEPRYKVPDDALWDFYQPFDHGMRMTEDWDLAESKAVPSLASDLIVREDDNGGGSDIKSPINVKRNASKSRSSIPQLKLELDTDPIDDDEEVDLSKNKVANMLDEE